MEPKMTFEEANKKLDQTVAKLESSELSLQESVKLYAEACGLLSFCMQELETCHGQITDINEKIKMLRKEGDVYDG